MARSRRRAGPLAGDPTVLMFSNGYLTLGRPAGVPVRLHWSLPLGALFVSRASFAPGIWAGFFLLVLIHEAGHAAMVRAFRLEVLAINIHALGGECEWRGQTTPTRRSLVAWGGVFGQAALFVVAQIVAHAGLVPRAPFFWQMMDTFVEVNLQLAMLNLVPIAPLDGAEAWKLPGLLRDAYRRRKQRKAQPALHLVRPATPPPPKPALKVARKVFAVEPDEPPPLSNEMRDEVERILRAAVEEGKKKQRN